MIMHNFDQIKTEIHLLEENTFHCLFGCVYHAFAVFLQRFKEHATEPSNMLNLCEKSNTLSLGQWCVTDRDRDCIKVQAQACSQSLPGLLCCSCSLGERYLLGINNPWLPYLSMCMSFLGSTLPQESSATLS